MTNTTFRLFLVAALLGVAVAFVVATRWQPAPSQTSIGSDQVRSPTRGPVPAVAQVAAAPVSSTRVAPSLTATHVRLAFADGQPLVDTRFVLAASDLDRDVVDGVLSRRTTHTHASTTAVTDGNGSATVEWSAAVPSVFRVWHDRGRLPQCDQMWSPVERLDATIPGGIIRVELAGGVPPEAPACRAVFRPLPHDPIQLTAIGDLNQIGTAVYPIWEDARGFTFHHATDGFFSVVAAMPTTGASASRGNVRFTVVDPDDTIELLLTAPSTGVIELVGADRLVGQSFAVRVRGANSFVKVFYSEAMPAGKFLVDVPIGPAEVELIDRFVAPPSTICTGASVEVEVTPGSKQVDLPLIPRARLRFHCRDDARTPVIVDHCRQGGTEHRQIHLTYFNAEGQLVEVRRMPVPGVRTYFGPQLEPGLYTVRWLDAGAGEVLKSVPVVVAADGFCDVEYP
ncbi:MAG: hypothetical protein INH34_17890 [Phycisphaerales bacterium]|nr:hypothetical protein [Phycisphaerales bacterium]